MHVLVWMDLPCEGGDVSGRSYSKRCCAPQARGVPVSSRSGLSVSHAAQIVTAGMTQAVWVRPSMLVCIDFFTFFSAPCRIANPIWTDLSSSCGYHKPLTHTGVDSPSPWMSDHWMSWSKTDIRCLDLLCLDLWPLHIYNGLAYLFSHLETSARFQGRVFSFWIHVSVEPPSTAIGGRLGGKGTRGRPHSDFRLLEKMKWSCLNVFSNPKYPSMNLIMSPLRLESQGNALTPIIA